VEIGYTHQGARVVGGVIHPGYTHVRKNSFSAAVYCHQLHWGKGINRSSGLGKLMKDKSTILVILLPLFFAAGMLLFFPFRFRFEFDFDEGINLIKAMLSMQGYQIYADFWSDQPPVLTVLLSLLFRVLGLNVNAGRILVLGFSALILFSAMEYLRRKWGILHAIIGMILIITLPFYTRLSMAIMIGLPSIALTMAAFLALIKWHESSGVFWLVLSAVFLALSVMTKIWTVILAPIFFAGILLQKAAHQDNRIDLRKSIRPLIIWSAAFVLVVGAVLLFIVQPRNIAELITPHLDASQIYSMQTLAEEGRVISFLDDSIPVFLLVPFGVIAVIRSRAWHALYLLAWALAALLLLTWNAPFWYHHQLLITIPSAILGAIAIGAAVIDLNERFRSSSLWKPDALFSLMIVGLSGFLAYHRIPPTANNFRFDLPNLGTYDPIDHVDFEIVALIGKYADETHYIFTDRPMYAFRSGMQVHPGLAVITQKRYSTGHPSQEEISAILEEIKPEQVIISRFMIPAIQEYMATRNFVRVDNSPRSRHYVRGDIFRAQ
jgi:hypothetical protein